MQKEDLREIARQLRRPAGEFGRQVGVEMNSGNFWINRYALDVLQAGPNENILEIGMGNGFFVKDILSRDRSITYAGCDFSDVMVEEAERINAEFVRSNQARFFFTDGDTLPFNDKDFDKIFTVNTVYFWDRPEPIFAEIRRVLKDEGRLIIAVRPRSVMEYFPVVKYGFNMFSKTELADLLLRNGFEMTGALEKQEMPQSFNGTRIEVGTLIVTAVKREN